MIGALVVGAALLLNRPAPGGLPAGAVPLTAATARPTPAASRERAGVFAVTGNLVVARTAHTATLLPDGRVLITGGRGGAGGALASTELYDPATGAFAAGPTMAAARQQHTATALADGRVLIAGGVDATGSMLASAEIYDPATGGLGATGGLRVARGFQTATLLADGAVLVAGGLDQGGSALASLERFDPAAGAFMTAGEMTQSRVLHSATLLADGRVLIAGGTGSGPGRPSVGTQAGLVIGLTTAEVFDPVPGRSAATGSLAVPRLFHVAVRLPDGRVLVAAGGTDRQAQPSLVALAGEVWDPATGRFVPTAEILLPRFAPTGTLLPEGTVLLVGGLIDGAVTTIATRPTTEVYDPTRKRFDATGPLEVGVAGHTATVLRDGRVLIAGGFDAQGVAQARAELYE